MPTLLNNSIQKALTTLARMKSFLGIGNDTHDSLLTMLINQATGVIERYTKRNLLSQTYTNEEYDGNGQYILVLKNFPITTFSSLQYRDSNEPDDESWSTFDTADYAWFADGRIQRLDGKFIEVPQKYRATYTAGYKIDFDNENSATLHTLPFEIEYVCQKIVAGIFNIRKAEGFSKTDVGDSSISLKAKLLDDPELRAILDRYATATL